MNRIVLTGILSLLTLPVLAVTPGNLNENAIIKGEKRLLNEAILDLDRAITINDRKAARYYHNRGYAQELKGDYEKAIDNYHKALRRNHYQLTTAERLGYLLYLTGRYKEAIEWGEYVLRLDPGNQKIPRWLPDAYAKLKEFGEKASEDPVAAEKREEKLDRQNYLLDRKSRENRHIMTASLDIMLRTGIYHGQSPAGYSYILDHGLFIDLPEAIRVELGPFKGWSVDLWAENPWLGGSVPDVNVQTEGLEATYSFGLFYVGMGVLLGHYFSDMNFSKLKRLTDIKVGFLFGFKTLKYDLYFTLYPRLLPADYQGVSKGITYDMALFRIDYEYIVNSRFSILASGFTREYFFFDHATPQSNYYGTFDATVGTEIRFFRDNTFNPFITLRISLTERIIFRDEGNNDPYAIGNGQGLLGINFSEFASGWPFSGIWGLAHVLTFRVDEYVKPYLFLYQSLLVEFPDWKEDHFELNLKIGLGVTI